MKILLLATSEQTKRVIEWLISNRHEIVGMVGDESVGKYAEEFHIPRYEISELNEKVLSELSPAIVVSYLYNKLIKEPLISFAKFGCINFHPAPLPDCRGRGGCNFAILEKRNVWGATAHFVDESFDTGRIINVFSFSFDYKLETAISLKKKTFNTMFDLFKSVISDIEANGRPLAVRQKNSDGKYYSYKSMMEQMKVDLDNDDIDTKIQAFWYPPYSGAYIEVNGRQYTLVNDFILKNLNENQ